MRGCHYSLTRLLWFMLKMKTKYLIIIEFILCYNFVFSSIVSVSSIKKCFNDGSGEILKQPNGTSCEKKLVVALTVEANEGKAQHLEINIRRLHDSTTSKDLELKTPIRVKVTKSPVLINYRLYQLGYVNANPYEVVQKHQGRRCRDDWYSKNGQVACRFQYDEDGERIFNSQGFCCKCRVNRGSYDRGESWNCLRQKNTAHCLKMHPLYMYVFGLYPPSLQYEITVIVEEAKPSWKKGGKAYFKEIERITLGPSNRISTSKNFRMRAEFVADFNPSSFMPVLAHKYLMIPNPKLSGEKPSSDYKTYIPYIFGYERLIKNVSEWLLVDKHLFDFTGLHCNKIGLSYTAFKTQTKGCRSRAQACLQSQPLILWDSDNERIKSKRKPLYKLHSFGKVHSLPHSKGKTNFQLNFIADKRQKSLITLSMEADSLKFVVNKSPGRIVEAYIDPFESLSIDGLLNVYVQNTGDITASYTISVNHCSGGIDWIPSKRVTLDPGAETNVTFTVHSFHSIGQINTCEVELLNQEAEVLDNLTVSFETIDTCFCYGYCGCTCGNNVTECPPKPTYQDPDAFKSLNINIPKLKLNIPELNIDLDVVNWLSGSLGVFIVSGLIISALIGLGVLKVVLMVYTGNVSCPAFTQMCECISTGTGRCCEKFGGCRDCIISLLCCDLIWGVLRLTKDGKKSKYIGRETLTASAKRPVSCDGTCRGAREARRVYRKKLRMMKRKGAKIDGAGPWWEKNYNCTCVVKDTKDIVEILKGLFFFIYCPLLPFWWSVEILFEWLMRRRRRRRRKEAFRARKEKRQNKKKDTYLLLDKYTRGKKEKKVVDFKMEKKKAQEQKQKEIAEVTMEEGKMMRFSSDEELGLDSTDTTATDEAVDIDELTDPGYPVYMNFAGGRAGVHPSLKSPGDSYSIKGRLTVHDGVYVFDLYKYTTQIKVQVKGKVTKLKKTNELNPDEFKQTLQQNVIQLLVTLLPLFTCLNK